MKLAGTSVIDLRVRYRYRYLHHGLARLGKVSIDIQFRIGQHQPIVNLLYLARKQRSLQVFRNKLHIFQVGDTGDLGNRPSAWTLPRADL